MIFEEAKEKMQAKQALKDEIMSGDEKKLSKKIIERYKQLYAENSDLFSLLDACEAAYLGQSQEYRDDCEIKQDTINLIHPCIEGQVASLVEQNLAVTTRGEGPSDQPFAQYAKIMLDWTFRKNHIKRLIERHERRREKFGTGIFKVYFDPKAINEFGLATITCPSLKKVFVDGKIKDHLRLQEADYIIETMPKSITWAREKYGKDKAKAIYTGIDPDTLEFSEKYAKDDDEGFTLLQVWTKEDGKLRMIELAGDGLILSDSFEKEKTPFYKFNKYPYFITPLYSVEGSLYGMGDAELLMPLQALINDLDDQIVANTRLLGQPITFIDPESEVDLDKITNEPGQIIPCVNPRNNIYELERKPVSDSVIRRKQEAFMEAQKQTRFSDLMNGISDKTGTATEKVIQQQQGNSAVDHKKKMLQETLQEMCEYLLSLMMENYTEAKAFRVTEDKDKYEWIDARKLNNIPVLKPATEGYKKVFNSINPDAEPPQWEILKDDETGEDMTKEIELDIEITIGAGLPKNKAFLFQLVKELSQMGAGGKPLLSYEEVRKLLKDLIDLPLEEIEQQQEMLGQQPIQEQPPIGPMPNADVQGMTPGNMPNGIMQGGGLIA